MLNVLLCFTGQSSTKDTIIKDVVIALTVIVTFVAMWYIYHLMNKVKPEVIYARRKARYGSCVLSLRHASDFREQTSEGKRDQHSVWQLQYFRVYNQHSLQSPLF